MKKWNYTVNKQELLKHMGSVSQLGGLKRYTFAEGRAKGIEAVIADDPIFDEMEKEEEQ